MTSINGTGHPLSKGPPSSGRRPPEITANPRNGHFQGASSLPRQGEDHPGVGCGFATERPAGVGSRRRPVRTQTVGTQGLAAAQHWVAPDVASDTPPTGWVSRDWGSVPPRDLTLGYNPNPNKGLVKGVLCGFLFLLELGVSSLSKGVSPPSPTALTPIDLRIQKWEVALGSD